MQSVITPDTLTRGMVNLSNEANTFNAMYSDGVLSVGGQPVFRLSAEKAAELESAIKITRPAQYTTEELTGGQLVDTYGPNRAKELGFSGRVVNDGVIIYSRETKVADRHVVSVTITSDDVTRIS